MEGASSGYEICAGQDVRGLIMDSSLLDAINALPEKRGWPNGKPWTPDMDAALLAGWGKKPCHLVAKVLGVAEKTARKRYMELTNV